jgi:exonuclease VII large subunit
LDYIEKRIESAHPKNILKRGFALIRNTDGAVLEFDNIAIHQTLNIEFIDGWVETTVKEKHKNG